MEIAEDRRKISVSMVLSIALASAEAIQEGHNRYTCTYMYIIHTSSLNSCTMSLILQSKVIVFSLCVCVCACVCVCVHVCVCVFPCVRVEVIHGSL